jgi:diguanylate cyclase (GGDEF)-like protein/PAS domain S-box-containing protein
MPPFIPIALLVVIAAQLLWIYLAHRRAQQRDELFRIITENAADMIALVDTKGRRLYNSPAYHRILGYSPRELAETPVFEQIHPDDRFKVLEAAREARSTGVGKSLQYRLRHKDGSWRTLESTASAIKNREDKVEKLVIVNRDVTERVRAEAQLEHHTLHDGLTGLPNRRLFLDRLSRCHARAQRDSNVRYAVLLADLDAFKTVNHSIGTDGGDQVLLEVARRLEASLRSTDAISHAQSDSTDAFVLSRMSGDDFAILLEACSTPSDVLRVAQRLQSALAAPLVTPQGPARCTLSIGSALSSQPPAPIDDLLREAESALRRARALGPGHCELSDHALHNQAVGRLKLEVDLRTALNQGQFRVYYQPVFRISPRQLVGFEALLRWQHPQQGLISPREFLDVAEDTGLMAMIDLWVLREACLHLGSLQPSCPHPLHLGVNISARHFSSPCLGDAIRDCLTQNSFPPSALQLGITEHLAMADPNLTAPVLSQIRRLGIRTAIDSFGAGSISLRALQSFAPDLLKIDRSLVLQMLSECVSRDAFDLIAAVAQKLPCQMLAQGVETVAQIEHLRTIGCQFAQGYLFSPPLNADATTQFLLRHTSAADTPVRGVHHP